MRCRLVAGAVGLGCAGLMALVPVKPAPAYEGGRSDCSRGSSRDCGPMTASEVGADCEQAAMDTPDRPAGLKVTTSVPNGARVAPGDDISVRLTWDPKAWSGPELDAALACVKVKGVSDSNLSSGERPAANDGAFEYVLQVPENIKPDCDICVQGFLIGTAADGRPDMVTSEQPCFMSGPPDPTPPVTRPPTSPVTQPPAPTTTTAPRTPTEVGGISATQPAPAPLTPAPAPAVAPVAELPRTGSPITALVSAAGGMSLTFGGLAVMGSASRRKRGRANR